MELFSISQLALFSGIKPHTIRIWEQRYGALKPNRSEGNTRYYDNSQLRRLLNIVSLLESDYKVSELCAMPDKKLFQLIKDSLQEHLGPDEITEYFISQLIAAGINYDEVYFEKIFSHCLLRHGVRNAYIKVIYPMLVRIGIMWAGDMIPPSQEHFISNITRQKLYTIIDSLPPARTTTDSWLLFLPENEFHDIGLLFASYVIRLSGKKVIYLGGDVPFQSLKGVIKDTMPKNLLLFLVHHNLSDETSEYLSSLCDTFTGNKIYVACRAEMTTVVEAEKRIHVLQSVNDLEQLLL